MKTTIEIKPYFKPRMAELKERENEKFTEKKWETKNKITVKKRKEVRGKNIRYVAIEEQDQAEIMNKYTKEMFDLENLEEIGVVGQLQEANITPSTLQLIDSMENGAGQELDRMDAEEWAKKYIDNFKKEQKEEKGE